jgi:hypothetical protein
MTSFRALAPRHLVGTASLLIVLAAPETAHAQFFGPAVGYGYGYPGFGYGYPTYGYGYGYPGYGFGGYPAMGFGYGGLGSGYGGYGYGAGFYPGYGSYLGAGYGYMNPLLGAGLTPLGVQSALLETSIIANSGGYGARGRAAPAPPRPGGYAPYRP